MVPTAALDSGPTTPPDKVEGFAREPLGMDLLVACPFAGVHENSLMGGVPDELT